MKVGKANYGNGNFKKKNYYKQVDGDVVFRIVPPIGDLADKGIWNRYHAVHFGYKNSEGKARPFESPLVKNHKTGMIEVPDAALDRINDLRAKLLEAQAACNGPLATKLNALVGMMGVYSLDKNYHMNVIDLQGNIGILKIRHKAKQLLDAEIKKLNDEGTDPLSVDDGRYFVFHRSGNGNDTSFKVSVYTEKMDIPGVGRVDKQVVHKITPALLLRLSTEASDLDNLTTRLTSEEVAEVVAKSDLLTGRSPACDEFFDARRKAARSASDETVNNHVEPEAPLAQPEKAVPYIPPVAVPASAPTPLMPEAVVAQPAPAAVVKASAIEEMSDEDFFKQIGANT